MFLKLAALASSMLLLAIISRVNRKEILRGWLTVSLPCMAILKSEKKAMVATPIVLSTIRQSILILKTITSLLF